MLNEAYLKTLATTLQKHVACDNVVDCLDEIRGVLDYLTIREISDLDRNFWMVSLIKHT